MTPILVPVPLESVIEVLPLINEFLDRGIEIDSERADKKKIVLDLIDGHSQLWIAWDDESQNPLAITITSIIEYPELKACSIDLCVGDNRKQWIHLIQQIEKWALENGCAASEIPFARPAWGRDLPDYKKRRIMLVKEL